MASEVNEIRCLYIGDSNETFLRKHNRKPTERRVENTTTVHNNGTWVPGLVSVKDISLDTDILVDGNQVKFASFMLPTLVNSMNRQQKFI